MGRDNLEAGALLVFAKIPVSGHVKTRLSPTIPAEDAARLYEAFLRDALDAYSRLDVAVRVFVATAEHATVPHYFPDGMHVELQKGETLGVRMLDAFARTFAEGFERAVIIGSDHPSLPVEYVKEAFRHLVDPLSVVIGPAEDGGYYLIGLNELYPALFLDMQFSHGRVFDETLERLARSDASVTILPEWYDIDEPESLARLASDLQHSDVEAPRTRLVLAELLSRRSTSI